MVFTFISFWGCGKSDSEKEIVKNNIKNQKSSQKLKSDDSEIQRFINKEQLSQKLTSNDPETQLQALGKLEGLNENNLKTIKNLKDFLYSIIKNAKSRGEWEFVGVSEDLLKKWDNTYQSHQESLDNIPTNLDDDSNDLKKVQVRFDEEDLITKNIDTTTRDGYGGWIPSVGFPTNSKGSFLYIGEKDVITWSKPKPIEIPSLQCLKPKKGYDNEEEFFRIDYIEKSFFISHSRLKNDETKESEFSCSSDWSVHGFGTVNIRDNSCEFTHKSFHDCQGDSMRGDFLNSIGKAPSIGSLVGFVELKGEGKWLIFESSYYEGYGFASYFLNEDLTIDKDTFSDVMMGDG